MRMFIRAASLMTPKAIISLAQIIAVGGSGKERKCCRASLPKVGLNEWLFKKMYSGSGSMFLASNSS